MSTVTKRPPLKETVGAQYIAFATKGEVGEFTKTYEDIVEKTEVVKKVNVSENSENTAVRASGKIYSNASSTAGTEISVEVIAFPAETIAKMRADDVNESGLILSGGSSDKPYFAYGKTVYMRGGIKRFDWYPKCQLTANTDDVETAEDKFKEQNDTLTIMAMPFDDKDHIVVSIKEDVKMPAGLTEELFFSKPILSDADLKDVLKGTTPEVE